MDSEILINSFEIIKPIDYLIISDNLFKHFLNNFSVLLLCKINKFDIFNMVFFFSFASSLRKLCFSEKKNSRY